MKNKELFIFCIANAFLLPHVPAALMHGIPLAVLSIGAIIGASALLVKTVAELRGVRHGE